MNSGDNIFSTTKKVQSKFSSVDVGGTLQNPSRATLWSAGKGLGAPGR